MTNYEIAVKTFNSILGINGKDFGKGKGVSDGIEGVQWNISINDENWQPRFYDHCIRDENDHHKHLDYIHYNPVKHGLVSSAGEWPHSSFARFVALGWYASA